MIVVFMCNAQIGIACAARDSAKRSICFQIAQLVNIESVCLAVPPLRWGRGEDENC